MFKTLTLACIILLCALKFTDTARILAAYPTPSISHQVVFRVLTRELVRRGHEVIVITPDPEFPKDQAPANLTEIDVHDLSYGFHREQRTHVGDFKIGSKSELLTQMKGFQSFCNVFELQLKSEQVQKIIKTEQHFDLILVEAIIRPALVFSHIFKAPIIQVSSFGAMLENMETIGAPTHSTLYPTPVFRQRLHNLSLWEKIQENYNDLSLRYYRYKNIAEENKILQRNFGQNVPTVNELVENVEMLFLNVHPMWLNNMPVPPGVVFMGGLHQKPKKELPQDLNSYLDESKAGVVYVSFGTNIHPMMFPPERLKVLTEALSELPYDVLFKWNDDELPGRTENIKISKWLPQSDILRHPNVKAFLLQGGLQSTDEAITGGVPVVCFPMFADQWYNAEQYEHFKIGLQLDFPTFTKSQLKNAIETVISNKSYRENIARLREQMNDQPQTPLERAVWWIEYVLRHGGARHLRAPAANMSWAEYYELQLVLVLLTAVFIIMLTISYLCLSLWRFISYLASSSKSKIKKS